MYPTSPRTNSPTKAGATSYGSPRERASPFKRPAGATGSPRSSAPTTPRSQAGPPSPSRAPPTIREDDDTGDIFTSPAYPAHTLGARPSSPAATRPQASPAARASPRAPPTTMPARSASPAKPNAAPAPGDGASKVAPALLKEMHESFQALDQDGDGNVNAGDVAEALAQLGQNAHPATLTTFFPPGADAAMRLPDYISTLAAPLAALSSPAELAAAFAAFDADDSGQIDVAELRDALLASYDGGAPLAGPDADAVIAEFAGKRAFARGQTGRRGDVFRWRDFVNATGGGTGGGGGGAGHKRDDSAGTA